MAATDDKKEGKLNKSNMETVNTGSPLIRGNSICNSTNNSVPLLQKRAVSANGNSRSTTLMEAAPILDIRESIDTVSLGCDTSSVVSKSSRSRRFIRHMSFKRSRAASWLTAKLRRHQKGTDLSAAFNLLDQENKGVLVNLNTATEEELMTVNGITRIIARSIVEYRAAIGGFRQMQDLALVSGIGAAKMATLCRDLSIGESCNETKESFPSVESLPSSPFSVVSAPTTSSYSSNMLLPPATHCPTSTSSSPPYERHSSLSTPGRLRPPLSSSTSSAATPSTSICPSPASHSTSTSLARKVNINAASIFELMTIPGINQEMAANIVHYREKKGPFKSVEEVYRVRGMRPKLTRHLHPHLVVTNSNGAACNFSNGVTNSAVTDSFQLLPPPSAVAATNAVANSNLNNNGNVTGNTRMSAVPKLNYSGKQQFYKTKLQGHRRTLSAPLNNEGKQTGSVNGSPGVRSTAENGDIVDEDYENCRDKFQTRSTSRATRRQLEMTAVSPLIRSGHRLSTDFSSDVYELLSLRSERPEINGLFENMHSGRPAIRMATWNLCKLTPDKLCNPGVMEVLCRTILEKGISILAVQDILGDGLLHRVSKELNIGSLRRVREWPGKKGTWQAVQSRVPVSSYTLCKHGRRKCPEYLGYIYNKQHVELMEDTLLDCVDSTNGSRPSSGGDANAISSCLGRPYIARFKSNELNFLVVNVHIKRQNLIYRSESFLQSSGDLHESLVRSSLETVASDRSLACDESQNDGCISDGSNEIVNNVQQQSSSVNVADGEDMLELIKSTKDLHNGLIKESILGREDILHRNSLHRHGAKNGGGDMRPLSVEDVVRGGEAIVANGTTLSGTAQVSLLQVTLEQLRERQWQELPVVVLGDFGVPVDCEGMFPLTNAGYLNALAASNGKNKVGATNSKGKSQHQHHSSTSVWLSQPLQQFYTGTCNSVREGLSHLAIPRGWGWGGLATPHCPLYVDLYTDTPGV